jgi:hypothetical protein
LSFSGFDETSFLSFDTTGIASHKAQVFECRSSRYIEILDSLSDGRYTSFTLTSETTTDYFDVNVKQTGVRCNCERKQDAISLRRL